MKIGKPLIVGVTTSINLPQTATGVSRFVAKTAGTFTLKDVNGTTIIDALPVTAGQIVELYVSVRADPINANHVYTSAVVTTAGGASGTVIYV